jgi:hypothetical protein
LDSPVLRYSHLQEGSSINSPIFYNYHLAHTLILWLIYQISPAIIQKTIIPGGVVSAVCGSLCIGYTFLVWKNFGLSKKQSVITAIVLGITPSFWFQCLIGEVYSIQMLFVTMFVYYFLLNKIIRATLLFLLSVLVSPLSAIGFSFILLVNRIDKKFFLKAMFCGTVSLICYLLIFFYLDADLSLVLKPFMDPERSILYKAYKFLYILLVNYAGLLIFCVYGIYIFYEKLRTKFYAIAAITVIQAAFIFTKTEFMTELGSFFLFLFWIASVFIGVGIEGSIKAKKKFIFMCVAMVAISFTSFWIVPNNLIALAKQEAGKWLKDNIDDDVKLIGEYDYGIGITIGRFGWDMKNILNTYIEEGAPNEKTLLQTNEQKIIIVNSTSSYFRQWAHSILPNIVAKSHYNRETETNLGISKKVYEDSFVTLYEWKLVNK